MYMHTQNNIQGHLSHTQKMYAFILKKNISFTHLKSLESIKFCSTRHVYDQKYSKNNNIVKYYNLK